MSARRARAPTLAEFLEDTWLPAIRDTIRPNTYRSYIAHIRHQIAPDLGEVRLDELEARTINRFYASLLSPTRYRQLAPETVRRVHATLRRALRDAQRWGYVEENVLLRCDPPKTRRNETAMRTWSPAQLAEFLRSVRADPLYPPWLLFAMTGMRRGEALGLRWCDVDLERAQLYVGRTIVEVSGDIQISSPKTARGRRVVALDVATVAALKAHRKNAGDINDLESLIFARSNGAPLVPASITRCFYSLVKQAGLPRIRLHDLRHTHATISLQAGVHPKIVSERLGHSTISFTLDVYSHAVPHMQAEAAEEVARLVLGNGNSLTGEEPGGLND